VSLGCGGAGETRRRPGGQWARTSRAAFVEFANRSSSRAGVSSEQIAGGARLERFEDPVVILEDRQHHDLGRGQACFDPADTFGPGHARQMIP